LAKRGQYNVVYSVEEFIIIEEAPDVLEFLFIEGFEQAGVMEGAGGFDGKDFHGVVVFCGKFWLLVYKKRYLFSGGFEGVFAEECFESGKGVLYALYGAGDFADRQGAEVSVNGEFFD